MTEYSTVKIRHATRAPGHPVLKGLAFGVAALAGFGLVFAQTYKTQVESSLVTEDVSPLLGPDRPAAPLPPTDGSSGVPVNILLMGSDDRSGSNGAIGGNEEGKRNDTTLIMHISADRSRIDVVSIPRDTKVKVADCDRSDGTSQKGWTGDFNIAFANGALHGSNSDGAACTIKTVEAITNIHIDHYAVIDFIGFRDMVDAVGGVPMCIPKAVSDPYSGTNLSAGPAVLNGNEALAYARMRHGNGLSGSDLDRIDRQQQLLKNLAGKLISAEMLYRPQDVTNFIKAVAGSLTLDPELGDLDFVGGLAYSLRNLDTSTSLVFATAPVGTDPGNKNKVVFTSGAADIWQAIIADQPISPLLDQQSSSPANTAGISSSAPVAPADGTPAADPNSEEAILAACTTG